MAHDPSASVDVSADPDRDNRHAVSFAVVRRGYDQLQVDHVLADMAAQVEALRVTADELREREADLLVALDAAEYRAHTAETAAEELAAATAVAVEEAARTAAFAAATGGPDPEPPVEVATADEGGGVPAARDAARGSAAAEVPVTDVAAMVGEETVRIVEAARHAALEIGARARQDAERIVAEARDEARSVRADAEVQLLHRTREADDAVAARLLEAADAVQDAQARAESIVDDAFTEAATVVLRAREEAVAVVAAAEQASLELAGAAAAARDDLLVDLVRRRKLLRRQVEQLEAGRVRLRSAYAVVEGAMAEATDELDRTVGEARDAAVAAAAHADATDDPEVRAAAAALGADADAMLGPTEPPAATEPPVGVDVAVPAERAEPAAGEGDREIPTRAIDADTTVRTAPADEADEPLGADTTAEIDLRGDEETEASATPATTGDGDTGAAPRATGRAEVATSTSTDPPSPRRRRRAPDPVEFEGRWSSAVRVLPPGPETTDLAPSPSRPAPRPTSASEVFARLRAGDGHQQSLFDPAEPSVPLDARDPVTAGGSVDASDGADLADPESIWVAQRDAAFAPALRALRRRLKATLADDEDSLLEAVRRSATVPDSVQPLRDARGRRDDLAAALVASLETAAAAGAELVAGTVDAGRGSPAEDHDLAVGQIAVELADAVVGPLDERLERCVVRYHRSVADGRVGAPDAPDDPAALEAAMASLVSSVKAAYRARRGAQVQVPTEHAVLLAGHRGLVAALEPGTPLRWLVVPPAATARRPVDEPQGGAGSTAEAQVCASCVAVADVGAGDPFGHGPLLPPARPGCRCAVAPVTAVVPRRP